MGNRMKNVWTALVGAMTKPEPSGSPSLPNSPFFRVAESTATSRSGTATRPEGSNASSNRVPGAALVTSDEKRRHCTPYRRTHRGPARKYTASPKKLV